MTIDISKATLVAVIRQAVNARYGPGAGQRTTVE